MPPKTARVQRKRRRLDEHSAGEDWVHIPEEGLSKLFDVDAVTATLEDAKLTVPAPAPAAALQDPGGGGDAEGTERVVRLCAEWTRRDEVAGFAHPRDLLPMSQAVSYALTFNVLSGLAAPGGGDWEEVLGRLWRPLWAGLRTLIEYAAASPEHRDAPVLGAAVCRYVHCCCAAAKVALLRSAEVKPAAEYNLGPVAGALDAALDAVLACSFDGYRHSFSSVRGLAMCALREGKDAPGTQRVAASAARLAAVEKILGHPYRASPGAGVLAGLDRIRDETTLQLCTAASGGGDATALWAAGFVRTLYDEAGGPTGTAGVTAGHAAAHACAARAALMAAGAEGGEGGARRDGAEAAAHRQQTGLLSLLAALADALPACVGAVLPEVAALLGSPVGAVRKGAVCVIAAVVCALGEGGDELAHAGVAAIASCAVDSDANVASRAIQEVARAAGVRVLSPAVFLRCWRAVVACVASQQSRVRLAASRALAPLLCRNPLTSSCAEAAVAAELAAIEGNGQERAEAAATRRRALSFIREDLPPMLQAVSTTLNYVAALPRVRELDAGCAEALAALLAAEAEDPQSRELLLSLPVDPLPLLSLLRFGSVDPAGGLPKGAMGDDPRTCVANVLRRVFAARYFAKGGTVDEFCALWHKCLCAVDPCDAATPKRLSAVVASVGVGAARVKSVASELVKRLAGPLSSGEAEAAAVLHFLSKSQPRLLAAHAATAAGALRRALDCSPGALPPSTVQLLRLSAAAADAAAAPPAGALDWLLRHPGLPAALSRWPEETLRLTQALGGDLRAVAYPALLSLGCGGSGEGPAARLSLTLRILAAAGEHCVALWKCRALAQWDAEQRTLREKKPEGGSGNATAETHGDGDDGSEKSNDDDDYMREAIIRKAREDVARKYVAGMLAEGALSRYTAAVLDTIGDGGAALPVQVRGEALPAARPLVAAVPQLAEQAAGPLATRIAALLDALAEAPAGAAHREERLEQAAELCAVCEVAARAARQNTATSGSLVDSVAAVMLWRPIRDGGDDSSDSASSNSSSSSSSSSSSGSGASEAAASQEKPRRPREGEVPDWIERPRLCALLVLSDLLADRAARNCSRLFTQVAQCVCARSAEVAAHARDSVRRFVAADPAPGACVVALFRALPSRCRRRVMHAVVGVVPEQSKPIIAAALVTAAVETAKALLAPAAPRGAGAAPDAAAFADLASTLTLLPTSDNSLALLVATLAPLGQDGETGERARTEAARRVPPSAWESLSKVAVAAKGAPQDGDAETAAGAPAGGRRGAGGRNAKRAAKAEALLGLLGRVLGRRDAGEEPRPRRQPKQRQSTAAARPEQFEGRLRKFQEVAAAATVIPALGTVA
eukprot:TRINITY_DN40430_c0_g2_i1.p1 TRINITY_DN40430_c0_g2~~TRINITY_DN40430_c0_g2_i1.p1  ORF type:complete len:1360 (+),score=376.10 TRINITY_DN40430_c0_g2_i1:118-4197(+)